MPNFLLIGAAKSGTTSVYHYLRQHPQVFMSPVKEPKFFAFEEGEPTFRGPGGWKRMSQLITDIDEYKALFADASHEKAVGEASAYYLYSEEAPRCIRRHVPDVKLVAVLRNPVERAYSHFLFRRAQGGRGREPFADFGRALSAEEARLREDWGPDFHYLRTGFYHAQLARYYELFEPEQIRVWLYEDLEGDPVGMVQSVYRFLGVDDSFVPDTSLIHNASGIPKNLALQGLINRPSALKRAIKPFVPEGMRRRIRVNLRNRNLAKPPMPEEVREELVGAYREDILKLQDLIGRNLSEAWGVHV